MTLRLPMLRFVLATLLALSCTGWAFAQANADYDNGVTAFQAGQYAAAAELFKRAENALPGKTQALLYEAKCFVHLENLKAAEDALRSYLVSFPNSSDALYVLGFVLNRENRPSESLRVYTQAAAIVRPTGDDLKIVGLDYVLLDDYTDAIKWLEKAVELDPSNTDAWYFLGRACYTKGLRDEAWKAFVKVLDLDSHNVKAKNNIGLILETDGKSEAALDAYRTAITWQENDLHPNAQPYVNLGNLLMEQGQIHEAVPALEKAVTLAPNDAYCHMILGAAYRQLGKTEQAQRELELATQLDPDNAKAHYQLGRLYKERHDLDRAQEEFKKTDDLKARAARPLSDPANSLSK